MGKPRVVIVGAGPGGLMTAKNLNGTADVTIIDAKGWHEINWGTPRVLVDPDFGKQALHSYQAIPSIGAVLQAQVTNVTDKSVALDTGAAVPYDYLVLAPGSTYLEPAIKSFAGTLAERKAAVQAHAERIKAADSIVIIGGGPVGVELAGEIVSAFPGKKLTIVTSAERLIAGKNPKIGRACANWLTSRGATVIVGQKATRQSSNSYVLTDGTTLSGDVVFLTVGGQPNTRFLNGLGILDANGYIKVNDKLQVAGQRNMFAVGDATDVKEVKLGYLASMHGQLAAKNIQASIEGKPLKAWKPNGGMEVLLCSGHDPTVMMVTLGPKAGSGHIGPVALTGCLSWMPAKLKAKDMFTGKTQKDLGIVV